MVAVAVENVSKVYQKETTSIWHRSDSVENRVEALKGISFSVNFGEIFAVIGSNGSGKSTLLKILSRITLPSKGRVELRGRVSSLLEIGAGFHPELSGRENVFLNGAILGMKRKEVCSKFDSIVDFADVGDFMDMPVKHYSSGMYVRLAFAVAAHLESEVVIADEVLAVGDHEFQQKCIQKIQQLRNDGRAILMVTHNMFLAQKLCRRALWLDQGCDRYQGPVAEAVRRYLGVKIENQGVLALKPPLQDKGVRIRKITAERNPSEPSACLDYSRDFFLGVEYDVEVETEDLHIGFRLVDEFGNCAALITTLDAETCVQKNVKIKGQSKRACVRIPGKLLKPSKYSLSVAINSYRHTYHEPSDTLQFIIDGAIPFLGEEVLRPVFDWNFN